MSHEVVSICANSGIKGAVGHYRAENGVDSCELGGIDDNSATLYAGDLHRFLSFLKQDCEDETQVVFICTERNYYTVRLDVAVPRSISELGKPAGIVDLRAQRHKSKRWGAVRCNRE